MGIGVVIDLKLNRRSKNMSKVSSYVTLTKSKKNGYLIKIDDSITGLYSLTTATSDELKKLWLLIGKELKKMKET
ncbi:MAG: hypothetical protein HYV37_03485 [Candidatus Levyibacteriota bacterium]|nr:MAG: hypothetical protein HYV37_03485 [Candidatus Levybacteria bacterium]